MSKCQNCLFFKKSTSSMTNLESALKKKTAGKLHLAPLSVCYSYKYLPILCLNSM